MFEPHWVFKNSHGGESTACESTDLSRGLGPHGALWILSSPTSDQTRALGSESAES